ncbi:unnamed protein product [Rhizophagus irregularis]|nr:unnamed protein product [Rhizophagus irregularis]
MESICNFEEIRRSSISSTTSTISSIYTVYTGLTSYIQLPTLFMLQILLKMNKISNTISSELFISDEQWPDVGNKLAERIWKSREELNKQKAEIQNLASLENYYSAFPSYLTGFFGNLCGDILKKKLEISNRKSKSRNKLLKQFDEQQLIKINDENQNSSPFELFGMNQIISNTLDIFDSVLDNLLNVQINSQGIAIYQTNFDMAIVHDEILNRVEHGCKVEPPNVVILEPGGVPNSDEAAFGGLFASAAKTRNTWKNVYRSQLTVEGVIQLKNCFSDGIVRMQAIYYEDALKTRLTQPGRSKLGTSRLKILNFQKELKEAKRNKKTMEHLQTMESRSQPQEESSDQRDIIMQEQQENETGNKRKRKAKRIPSLEEETLLEPLILSQSELTNEEMREKLNTLSDEWDLSRIKQHVQYRRKKRAVENAY